MDQVQITPMDDASAWEMRRRREKRTEAERKEFEAIFTLAGLPIEKTWVLENNYWPKMPTYFDIATPWYLFRTPLGLIRIGWRKRVISIHWEDTPIRCEVTADEVTKEDTMVHAWTPEKAVEYLKELRKHGCDQASPRTDANQNEGCAAARS
jgi:hypothetical protein